jgi:hypothetical protein
LNDHAQARHCAQRALSADGSDFHVRFTIGQYLLAQKHFTEAEEHLKWCLARKPGDKQLRAALESATRGRIDTSSQFKTASLKSQI